MNTSKIISRHKLLIIAIATIIAFLLPGAIVFASDNVPEATVDPAAEESATPATEEAIVEPATTPEAAPITEESANITVTGTLTDDKGNAISEDKDPYVMIAWITLLGADQKRIYLKDGATNFTIEDVPSTILKGVITAGAKGYANEIFILPDSDLATPKNFTLYAGAECTFVNEEEKLGEYKLCAGSSIYTREGHNFTLDLDYGIGAGLPVFGVPLDGVFKETIDPYTSEYSLTYNYQNPVTKEKFHLIFEVVPESEYQFNYITLNDEIIPSEGYKVETTDNITIKPIFTERGKMIVGGIVKDKTTGKSIEGAYGYIIGVNILTGEMYYSKMKKTDADGIFVFENVPDGLKGVIVGGAPGHTTQPQYLSYYVPRTEFNLNPGVVCTIEAPDELSTVMIEAGSKIKIDGFDEIVLPMPVDLGNEFPPLGFPNDGKMNFKDKGVVEYSFTHDDPQHSVKSLDLILKAYPKSGYGFKNWLVNGEEFSGELSLSTITEDFKIKPVYKDVGPYTFSTYIQNESGQKITNGYAYMVGLHSSTKEAYFSDVVATDSSGVFTISDIPNDVIGLIVVGAPGYVNRFQYVDCDVEATFFTLSPGVQCSFDLPETASTVLINKGSGIKAVVDGIPIELALPSDIDFGNFFLPFGMSFDGTFNFMENGKLNYSFTRQSNRVDIQSLNVTFEVLPKDGYVFKGWLKDGQAISGEYELKEGEADFVIAPVFEAIAPIPTPDPGVKPASVQTFDSWVNFLQAFGILVSAFAVVFLMRRFLGRKF